MDTKTLLLLALAGGAAYWYFTRKPAGNVLANPPRFQNWYDPQTDPSANVGPGGVPYFLAA